MTVSAAWRLFLALCLALCIVEVSVAEPREVYDINLRAQSVADALNGLSEQTGAPVVFPYDLVRDRKSNPVIGRYKLLEALDALLKDTGLSGGLSDKGVLVISEAKSGASNRGETIVTTQETQQNINKPKRSRMAGIAALLSSVAAAFTASAEEADRSFDQGTKMEDVLITAQKHEEKLQDVPVPVTVLDANDLIDNNYVALRDYFDVVPGFNVTPNIVGTQNLSIRGVTTGGLTTPTVGVVIDDVAFGASSGSHGDYIPDLDPSDLARVEVLRGPQGTLYGANSMGGLLKFVTVDPSTNGLSGRIETGTSDVSNGSEPGYNLRGSVNVPVGDELAVRGSAFTRQDPGYIDNPVLRRNGVNRAQVYGGRLSALWRPMDTVSLKVSALLQDNKTYGLDEVVIQPGLSDLQQNYIAGAGADRAKLQAYSAILKAKIGAVNLTSLTGYNVSRQEDSVDFGFAFSGAVNAAFGVTGAPYYSGDTVSKFSQELRLNGTLGESFEWLVGGFYTRENDASFFSVPAVDTATGKTVGEFWYFGQGHSDKFDERAAFTDLTYKITDQIDIQVGGRESHLKVSLGDTVQLGPFVGGGPVTGLAQEADANAFTYLVTPRFKITPDLMLYGRFASGYRPGTPNLPVPGQPRQSDPDKTKTYEVGAKGALFDHRFSFDASIYYIDWKDIQIQLTDPVSHLVYNTNGAGAKSEGAELSLTANPLQGLTVGASVSYDNAVLTQSFPVDSPTYGVSGDRLPLSSRYTGNLSLEQRFPLWADVTGFLGADASYVGNRIGVFGSTAAPERQYFPAYTKTNLRAGATYDSWKFNLFVNNVSNSRALTNGGIGYFYPAAHIYITPRTVGLNVVKTF